MSEQNRFDDRPPIDVSRFHASVRERMLEADHVLGLLEAGATHARNEYREMVRSDDVAANAELLGNVVGTLGECVKFAVALHGDFAAFAEAHREEPGASRATEMGTC